LRTSELVIGRVEGFYLFDSRGLEGYVALVKYRESGWRHLY
jgi:hypothetical protein